MLFACTGILRNIYCQIIQKFENVKMRWQQCSQHTLGTRLQPRKCQRDCSIRKKSTSNQQLVKNQQPTTTSIAVAKWQQQKKQYIANKSRILAAEKNFARKIHEGYELRHTHTHLNILNIWATENEKERWGWFGGMRWYNSAPEPIGCELWKVLVNRIWFAGNCYRKFRNKKSKIK